MEQEEEFIKQVGKNVLDVLMVEVKGGKMEKNEVKKLALKLGDECHGAYKDNSQSKAVDILENVLDAWIKQNADNIKTKNENVDQFVNALTAIGRRDLAAKIKSKETTAIKTEDSGTKRKAIKHTWFNKTSAAPGTKATPDDQGDTVLCTSYAMAKVIFDGLDEGEWTNGEQINVDGETKKLVQEKMVHVHKDEATWPSDFDEQSVCVEDKKNCCYKVKLTTETLVPNKVDDPPPKFSEDNYRRLFAILVVKTDRKKHALHSLYCKKYNAETREFSCINSWGSEDNPTPKYKDDDKRIVCLTLVNATVEKTPKC